jgi:hypothetical protein
MPDKLGRLPEVVGDRVESIVIAIAAGKNNDAKFHGFCFCAGGNFDFTRRARGKEGAGRGAVTRGGCDAKSKSPVYLSRTDILLICLELRGRPGFL